MKSLKHSLLILLAFVQWTVVTAQDKEKWEPKFKKTKNYSKSYSFSGSDKLVLNNQFGEMKLVTWDKNEVKLDATITGKSDDEQRAQEILDRISINDSKDGSTVSFQTKFADNKKDWNEKDRKEGRHEGMEINYTVYLPAGANLKAENQFGKMIVPELKGDVTLVSKFGSLNAGRLSNPRSVTVEFGKADIAYLNGGDLTIKFSQGKLDQSAGNLDVNVEFSQVKLDIGNETKGLTIHNSYSTLYLDLDKNLSASYDIVTSHGSFNNKSDFAIKRQGGDDNQYGPRFTEKYTGTSGSGSCRIKVNASFGEVVAGHNLQVDLSEKKKNKPTRTI